MLDYRCRIDAIAFYPQSRPLLDGDRRVRAAANEQAHQEARWTAAFVRIRPVARSVDLHDRDGTRSSACRDHVARGRAGDLGDGGKAVCVLPRQPARHRRAVRHAHEVDPPGIHGSGGNELVGDGEHEADVIDGLQTGPTGPVEAAVIPDAVERVRHGQDEALSFGEFAVAGPAVEHAGVDAAAMELDHERQAACLGARLTQEVAPVQVAVAQRPLDRRGPRLGSAIHRAERNTPVRCEPPILDMPNGA